MAEQWEIRGTGGLQYGPTTKSAASKKLFAICKEHGLDKSSIIEHEDGTRELRYGWHTARMVPAASESAS